MGRKGRQVFIGGLSLGTEAEDLRKFFAEIGGITYATVWRDADTGETKGAGKVEFESPELAQRAIEALRAPGAASGNLSFATAFADGDAGNIDLQYDRAIQWLACHGKLQEDWHAVLAGIRAKGRLALKDALPSNASALGDLDYFKIKEVLEKSGDFKEKPSLKEVLELYTSSNVHMVEAVQTLVQMVRHEIPAAKQQAASCQKEAQDAERRQRDLAKREAEDRRKLKEICDAHELAYEGNVAFAAELASYISKALPNKLEDIAAQMKTCCPKPLAFYVEFTKSLTKGDSSSPEIMPLLHYLSQHGNASLKDVVKLSAELEAEFKKLSSSSSVTVLASTRARGLVVDELLELQAFLTERSWELEEIEKGELQQNANVKLLFNLEETKAFHSSITAVVDALCGKELQPLLLLHGSEAKQTHLVSNLTAQKASCEKCLKESSILEERKKELSAESEATLKEASQLQERVRHLKGWLEEELSRLAKKYKVRLVGEVSSI